MSQSATASNVDAAVLASAEAKAEAARALLSRIAAEFSPAALASSLSVEDMLLTELIAQAAPAIEVFSLDTGRLHEETYTLMDEVRRVYGGERGLTYRVYVPNAEALQAWVDANGVNAFYLSVELRKACCGLRKVEPLNRALTGKQAWITGMRAQQSATRTTLPVQDVDADRGIAKFNPLADWSEAEVWAYVRTHGVPYNALHDRFFPSIGCAPCTRAVAVGEDVRAGRWWWEDPQNKECGLHVSTAAASSISLIRKN